MSDRMSAESATKLCTVTRKTLILNQHCALLQMTVYMHCKKQRLARTEEDSNTPHLLYDPCHITIIICDKAITWSLVERGMRREGARERASRERSNDGRGEAGGEGWKSD